MLSVLVNWIYILFTTICLGYGFSKFVFKSLNYTIKKFEILVAMGLVIATVYAQIFSLFYKVGLVANVCLLLICTMILLVYRKEFYQDSKFMLGNISLGKGIVITLLVLFWGYCTSRGYAHYDSDLYHAQSIRWIEEYGIVKGLGNLHARLGYNSSIFSLSALYSFKFLIGQSLHAVNGLMALLLSISLIDIVDSFKRKRFLLSDYVRLAAIYYLNIIWDEVVSPASDYAIMCTIFYIIIKWVAALERKEKSIVPYALLCVGGVYAVSLKLTAGLILILVLKPAYMLIKEKRIKEILVYLLMGSIVICPWIIRNVILSGYLIYPYPAIDLFSVAWKVDPALAEIDAAEIKTWGRAVYDATKVNIPIWEWFGNWFKVMLSGLEKVLIIGDLLCVLIAAMTSVYVLVRKKWEYLDYLLIEITVVSSYLFWQINAPLIRYGYAYVLLVLVLTLGFIKMNIKFDKLVYYCVLVLFSVKLVFLIKAAYGFADEEYYVWQKDYGKYKVATYEVDGETFYYPVGGDRVGYYDFPATISKLDIEFIGNEIKDGFKIKNNSNSK